jgi:hypothetical protein
MPGLIRSPVPRLPKFGNLRRLVHRDPDAMANHVAHDTVAMQFDVLLNRMGDVADAISHLRLT